MPELRTLLTLLAAATLTLVACDDPAPQTDADSADGTGVDANDAWSPDTRLPDASDTAIFPPDATLVRFGGGTIVIEEEPFRWRIDPNDAGVTRVRSDPAQPFIGVETSPVGVEEPFHDPRPALSIAPQLWEVVNLEQEATYRAATFTLRDPDAPDAGTLTVAFIPSDIDTSLHIDATWVAGTDAARRLEFVWQDEGGPLLGGGSRLGPLDARGELIPLFLAEDPFDDTGTNRANLPIPFIFNIRGYGVFFETTRAGVLDLTGGLTQRARFDTHTLSVRLWAHRDPYRSLESFVARTGLPTPPPTWALAPLFGRRGPQSSQTLLADAAALRKHSIPAGALLFDAPWFSAQGDFTFNTALHPDPAALMETLRAQGFDSVLTVYPYLGTSDDSELGLDSDRSQALFDQAASDGHLVTDPTSSALDIPWAAQRTAGIVDFTNPDAVAWWAELARPTVDLGVRGFRLDGGENIWVPPQGSPDLEYRFADGRSERDLHRLYSNLYHEAFAGLFDDAGVDGFICGRAGTWGAQQSANCFWPPMLKADFTDPNGLRAAVRAALNLSASGVPFFSSEIAGEADGKLPSRELLLRWTAFSVFNTTMQFVVDAAPWEAPYTTGDMEIVRKFASLRVQLTPYLANQLAESARTGVPVIRPMVLSHVDEPTTWDIDDAFYFGERMIVAPILEDGKRSRNVYLPRGVWLSWDTGEEFSGEDWVVVDAALDQIPMFVRSGSVVPLRLDTVETLSDATDPDVVDAAATDGTLHIKIFGRATNETPLPGGVTFRSEYVTLTDTTRITFLTSEEGVKHAFVELIGNTPREIICDEETLPEDDTLFIRTLDGSEPAAIRRLSTSTLVRLPTSRNCTIVWY